MRFFQPAICLTIAFVAFSCSACFGQQDTVVSLQQARARLLKNNLGLLASFYDVNIAEARLVQAKLWNNPYFIYNQELYSPATNDYFSAKHEFLAQIEEVFSIAGKHTNTVKLAKINVAMSRMQFQDAIRSLLYDLGKTYNDLAALEEKERLYQEVLASYERLIVSSEKELKVGVISVTEELRIKSEYITVKAQAVDNYNQQEQMMSHLRLLLNYPKDTSLVVEQRVPVFSPNFQLDTLINRAIMIRPDLKVGQLTQEYSNRNLKLQYSKAVPDLKIGYVPQDLASNYTRQFTGINLEFPLPLFDRNQGGIKEARSTIAQSNYQYGYQKSQVINQVIAAFRQYIKNNEALASYTTDFLNQLDDLNRNTNINFQKRNITLLEFIDQQRIYITTNIQVIELRQLYLNSVNELNFSIGENFIEN